MIKFYELLLFGTVRIHFVLRSIREWIYAHIHARTKYYRTIARKILK